MKKISARDILIYALDADGIADAREQVKRLQGAVSVFKIGFQLFLREGTRAVKMVHEEGGKVFLDLKFHDIPSTVEKAAREAVRMGVFMFNVHAGGGRAMMQAAVKGAREEAARIGFPVPRVLGVTVLTSLDREAVREIGFRKGPAGQAEALAALAARSGLAGVVASPREAARIKKIAGREFLVVCPGIRPSGADKGDQSRIETPAAAVKAGADYLVVGRPIRDARDPAAAARAIMEEALNARRGK
ncbi:MAG TPA: orotidine-5'-phosphate decarboxylase [bacterium]|nr:orotidine-5'-phosphate decarboxylase [bacterium]